MADAILAQSGIYQIRNTVNGKVYVGSAVNVRARLQYHRSFLNNGKHVNQKLQRAWIKYGSAAFELAPVEYIDDPAKLLEREQHWIDSIGAVDTGYNIRRVAQSNFGLKASEATKAKMSAAQRGRKMSPEAKRKISIANKGKNRFSPEQITRMSVERKGRTHTDDAKAKIAAASRGRVQSPELVARRAATLKATVAARGPIAISDETRVKLSAALKGKPGKGRKPVLLFGVTYESITAASIAIGRNPQWVKARIGTDHMPDGDIHARPPVSAETRMKRSMATKGVPKSAEMIAKRVATCASNRAAKLAATA